MSSDSAFIGPKYPINYERSLDLLKQLEVPACFLRDTEEDTPSESKDFLESVVLVMKELSEIFTTEPENALNESLLDRVIFTSSKYLRDVKWSSEYIRDLAAELLAQLSQILHLSVAEMVDLRLEAILQQQIKPLFKRHPGLEKNFRKHRGKKTVDQEFYENQAWKSDCIGAVTGFKWCLQMTTSSTISHCQELIVPPLLTLVDDFDIRYKTIGVEILDLALSSIDISKLRKLALDQVFYEALTSCLTYRSNATEAELLSVSLSTILHLVNQMYPQNTKEWFLKVEEVFLNGIVDGFSLGGDNIAVRSVIIQKIPLFLNTMGPFSIQYLSTLVKELTRTLKLPILDDIQGKDIHLLTAQSIEALIQIAWPRLDSYCHDLLTAILVVWVNSQRKGGNPQGMLNNNHFSNLVIFKP
ncbi:hypothetical protein K7432_007401 [Basidiobolus ranarum]|uniref:Uncharacterized protein n=1 Tax=Basidiobolus ranarum TaxID=34480 RepID=A0ABR2WTI4_9FUNG